MAEQMQEEEEKGGVELASMTPPPQVGSPEFTGRIKDIQKRNRKQLAEGVGIDEKEITPERVKEAEKVATGEKSPFEVDFTDRKIASALIGLAGTAIAGLAGGAEAGAAFGGAAREAEKKLSEIEAAEAEERQKKQAAFLAKEEKQADRNFQLGLMDIRQANAKELAELKAASDRQLAFIKGEKTSAPKTNQFQAATFGKRLEQAEQVFDTLSQSGVDPTSVSFAAQRSLPEFLKSDDIKQQEQAERNFVNAVLRRESGAAISASEFESAEAQYFPRIGDSQKVLDQKKVNRLIALNALKAEAGPAFEQIPTIASLQTQVSGPAGQRVEPGSINAGQFLETFSAFAGTPQAHAAQAPSIAAQFKSLPPMQKRIVLGNLPEDQKVLLLKSLGGQ